MIASQTDVRLGRASSIIGALAFLLAVGASVFLVVGPTYTSTSSSSSISSDGTETVGPVTTSHATLLEENGRGVLIPLAVPVVLAGAGAVLSLRRRWWPAHLAVAGVLFAGCLLGAMTIGLFYIPAASALMLSAGLSGARTPRPGAARNSGNGSPVVP
jgi:hypothetical protein